MCKQSNFNSKTNRRYIVTNTNICRFIGSREFSSGATSVYSTIKNVKKNGNGLYLKNRGSGVTKKKILKKKKTN